LHSTPFIRLGMCFGTVSRESMYRPSLRHQLVVDERMTSSECWPWFTPGKAQLYKNLASVPHQDHGRQNRPGSRRNNNPFNSPGPRWPRCTV